jgi:hypothetical protein
VSHTSDRLFHDIITIGNTPFVDGQVLVLIDQEFVQFVLSNIVDKSVIMIDFKVVLTHNNEDITISK